MNGARDHGPLPVLLVLLTVMTGLVDSFSYLELGNVFVANMTGNVIFFGFEVGGGGETRHTILLSAVSTVFFCVGAAFGGRLGSARLGHRGLLLSAGTAAQACVLGVTVLIVVASGHTGTVERKVLIALLAMSMGWQFAIVRRIDVPEFRTVVITTTLTSLVADRRQSAERLARKTASIGALLLGAAAGPVLIRGLGESAPLWGSAALLLVVAVAGLVTARRPGSERWG